MSATTSQEAIPIPEEYAVIGSVLQRPHLAEVLAGWPLQAEDFVDPWMGALYHALVEQRLYAHPAVRTAPFQQCQAVPARMVLAQLEHNARTAGRHIEPELRQRLAAALDEQLIHPHVTPHPEAAAEYGRAVLRARVRHSLTPWAASCGPSRRTRPTAWGGRRCGPRRNRRPGRPGDPVGPRLSGRPASPRGRTSKVPLGGQAGARALIPGPPRRIGARPGRSGPGLGVGLQGRAGFAVESHRDGFGRAVTLVNHPTRDP